MSATVNEIERLSAIVRRQDEQIGLLIAAVDLICKNCVDAAEVRQIVAKETARHERRPFSSEQRG